jgi:hypothetical protein
MRRKKLISPEKPTEDGIEYKFKALFLPNLSHAVALTILGAFCITIFALTQLQSPIIAIRLSIAFLLSLLLIGILSVLFEVKACDLLLTSAEISGPDLLYRRNRIKWGEIGYVKQYNLFGLRHLSIKTDNKNSIQFQVRLYKISQLLDRVRELAGADHILVRALEKELSRPRYELTKIWCGVIGSIGLITSIYLIGGNMYAAEQEKPLEQAIASYTRQHPKTTPNQSAIELQALMTKLGLSVDIFGDGSPVKVTPKLAASDQWRSIEIPLSEYLTKQLDKTEDSIPQSGGYANEPIPTKVLAYLKTHQADLDAIETHLATNPVPEWGVNSWIEQGDITTKNNPLWSQMINVMSISKLENLVIVNLLNKQQPNVDLSRNLVALEKIQKSVQPQQSLVGQLVSIIGEGKISKLVRQIDSPQPQLNQRLPKEWGNNLFGKERYKNMIGAIEHESIVSIKFLQNRDLFDQLLIGYNDPLRFIPGLSYLVHPHLRLAAVDQYQEFTKGIAYWNKQNICRTDGKSMLKSNSGFDDYLISMTMATSQYPRVFKQDLFWELTTSVRQVKAKLAAGENINLVAQEFNLPSQVCTGEKWTAKASDGAITISFSRPPDLKALGLSSSSTSLDPMTYTIKSISKK